MRIFTALFLLTVGLAAQPFPAAEDLPSVGGLPPLLQDEDGSRIESGSAWTAQRDRLKAMLAYYQYGRTPPNPGPLELSALNSTEILGGRAIRSLYTLTLHRNGRAVSVRVVVVRPNRPGRFPTVIKNDRYAYSLHEIDDRRKFEQYSAQKRDEVDAWVYETAVERGYAVVKFNRGDVAPDRKDSTREGVLALYPEPEYDWATIAAWAWFYQPLIDHLVEQQWVDPDGLIATGHSRGGKTALCAGIYDDRIAVTVPSASGSGGAGSWRTFTQGGQHQDVRVMTQEQPHWFTSRLTDFVGQEHRLPIGSHTAKALIAPRALLNTQGADDSLANPAGTRLTFEAAQKVFELLGVPERQAVHWRPGGHGQLQQDWLALFDFSDQVLFGKSSDRVFNNWPADSANHTAMAFAPNFVPIPPGVDPATAMNAPPPPHPQPERVFPPGAPRFDQIRGLPTPIRQPHRDDSKVNQPD